MEFIFNAILFLFIWFFMTYLMFWLGRFVSKLWLPLKAFIYIALALIYYGQFKNGSYHDFWNFLVLITCGASFFILPYLGIFPLEVLERGFIGFPLHFYNEYKQRKLQERLAREYGRAKAREEERIRRENVEREQREREEAKTRQEDKSAGEKTNAGQQERAKSRSREQEQKKTTNDSHQQKESSHGSNLGNKNTGASRETFFDDVYIRNKENVTRAFQVLGLDPTGSYSKADILNAYRKESLKTHPDLNGSGSNDIMQVLNRAKDIILANL